MRLLSKIHGKSMQILLVYRSKVVSLYRSFSTHVIHIDGGLGSQIMQFSLYLRLKQDGKRVVLDASYYENQVGVERSSAVTSRSWELEPFGYFLADSSSRRRIRLRDSDFARLYLPVYRKLIEDQSFLASNFFLKKVQVGELLEKLKLTEEELDDVTVMHLRQGDFLKVASFLLGEDYYIEAIAIARKLTETTGSKLVIVSDEEISEQRWPRLHALISGKSEESEVLTLVGHEPIVVHEFMRSCGTLICSNSNFSFTAAMFRKGKISIYPSKFYEGQTAALNPIFKLPFGVELKVI